MNKPGENATESNYFNRNSAGVTVESVMAECAKELAEGALKDPEVDAGAAVVDWWNAVEPRPVTLIWALTYALSGRLTCEHFRESARLAGAPNDA